MCGEKHPGRRCSQPARGSPPRVRGKAYRPFFALSHLRITPACAGKRSAAHRPALSTQGSPPRVRGKVLGQKQDTDKVGITPACAGKSDPLRRRRRGRRDHPRVCGEKPAAGHGIGAGAGSPPRVRGKVPSFPAERPRHGITPACAGKRSRFPRELRVR